MRYSMRRVSVRNSSVAVRPFRAVHLKSRRFHCFSGDIFFISPWFLLLFNYAFMCLIY